MSDLCITGSKSSTGSDIQLLTFSFKLFTALHSLQNKRTIPSVPKPKTLFCVMSSQRRNLPGTRGKKKQ